MRLWSLHPALLDPKGLVALWREALLAQQVLAGRTKGYRHHPQLLRFRSCPDPVAAISTYLWAVHDEARRRGFRFDASRIRSKRRRYARPVTLGQLEFELVHLKRKLELRDGERLRELRHLAQPRPHPMFRAIPGEIEPWERSSTR